MCEWICEQNRDVAEIRFIDTKKSLIKFSRKCELICVNDYQYILEKNP